MYPFLAALLLSLTVFHAIAQPAVSDSSSRSGTVEHAVTVYHQVTDEESPLYRGPEHIGYPAKMIGSAYFAVNNWQNGSITYDSVLYQDIPMLYDQVRDKVVIRHFNGVYMIELINDKVKWFALGGHTFVNLNEGNKTNTPKAGFYDVLASGTITLLAKTEKSVEDFIEGNEVKQRIKEKTTYYAVKDHAYYVVNTKRSLFDLFGDRKKEMQQYLRKNKIKFRRKSQQALIKATQYYNQLTR